MLLLFSIILLTIVFAGLLFVIIIFIFLLFDAFLDLPYVATQRHKIEVIMKFAQVKKGETVVDLGSGDGRLLFASAARGAKAIGYEINPFLIVLTRIHTGLKGLSENIRVPKRNLWKADLKVADVIFVYGKRKTMQKFEDFVYQNAKKRHPSSGQHKPFSKQKTAKRRRQNFSLLNLNKLKFL